MTFSKISLCVLATAAMALSGCSTSRFGDNNPQPQMTMPRPPSSGSVTQTTLPPPGGYPAAPTAPVEEQTTQMASLEPPANASDLTPASVAGVWKASVSGMNCQIATPQTKFGQGYRAGPLHCPASFSGVNSWAVNGKQLSFYDASGSSVATLYSTGAGRFEGRTSSGQSVILSR